MKKLLTLIAVLAVSMLLMVGPAQGASDLLTVDGATYAPSHVSGPVFHYETPDTDPTVAFTDRNVWTGNGSELLPCEGGIHWIDNKNVLTVSHCLPFTPTTTTTTPTTTTTVVTTTTTSSTTSTTTTLPTTTTTSPTTTTTPTTSSTLPSTTTTIVVTTTTVPGELPETGMPLLPLALAGIGLLVLGYALIRGGKPS